MKWSWGLLALFALAPSVARAAIPERCSQARRLDLFPAAVAVGAKPVEFSSLPAGVSKEFESLCWTADEKSGRLIDENGDPLTQDEYEYLIEPLDSNRHPLEAGLKSELFEFPCRFDHAPIVLCRMGTADYQAFTNLDYLSWKTGDALDHLSALMARLKPRLSGMEGDRPLSDSEKAEIRTLIHESHLEGNIPPFLEAALEGTTAIRDLRDSLNGASAQLDALFDGGVSLGRMWEKAGATAVHTGEWAGSGARVYFDSRERQIGTLFQRETERVLGANPVGRRILERFRDPVTGELRLPAFVIGDERENAGAHYSSGNNVVVIGLAQLRGAWFSEAKSDERARIFSRTETTAALYAYLHDHPEEAAHIVRLLQVDFAHELTHAGDDREIPIGYYGQADILQKEYKAYRTQNEYLLAELAAHPEEALSNPGIAGRLVELDQLLASYDEYAAGIARRYVEKHDGADIQEVLAWQRAKRAEALDPSNSSSPLLYLKRLAKAWGILKSQEATEAYAAAFNEETRRFLASDYPSMRSQAKALFPQLARRELAKSAGDPPQKAGEDLLAASWLAKGSGDDGVAREVSAQAASQAARYLDAAAVPGAGSFEALDGAGGAILAADEESQKRLRARAGVLAQSFIDSATHESDAQKKLDGFATARRLASIAKDKGLVAKARGLRDELVASLVRSTIPKLSPSASRSWDWAEDLARSLQEPLRSQVLKEIHDAERDGG